MALQFSFRPKLADALKNYSAHTFFADLAAGITVGIVALPLAMALAIASGLKPEIGIFTAIIGGLLVSLLGGSRVQIGGPAGAFVPLLAPIVMVHGPEALVVCALMAGVILFVLGACKLGTMIKYIPYPVVTGFTSGIAIIILSTQIRDFFGLQEKLPSDSIGKLRTLVENFHPNWPTVLLAVVCTLAIWFWPKKLGHRVPGSIVVILIASFVVKFFRWDEQFGIQTLFSQFGEMPRGLPAPHWPDLPFEAWRALLPAAMTVAVLGAIESLLCAVVADGMIDDRHDSNQELMGQGIANVVVGIFGGMPTTGVIARTATNVRSGGRTPVAGIIHSLTLLVILLVAAPLAKNIPMAALSAVLVVVALRMGEWHQFKRMAKWPRSDAMVFLCAFSLTVMVDLPVAVGTSLILASALLVKRLAETAYVEADPEVTQGDSASQQTAGRVIPQGVLVFRIFGAFFFGAADKLESSLRRAGELPEVLILRMRDVLALDATGIDALEDLLEKLRLKKKELIICGPHSQPLFALTRAGFMERIGAKNVCGDMESSLARAGQILEQKKNKKAVDTKFIVA
ncbi:MAG TPA: SulP family inorganic anion transporter [Candidatus Sulfotelmatobacter sp.]|nr:SulP family inorganic anion transporter [Candidatus Sulfotelmatobacter sp.]